jgi:hypothetical protein
MNNRFYIGGVLCDLKKASDCVNHGILVDKLECYGINGKFLSLIHSYGRERHQKVLNDIINAFDSVSSRQGKVMNRVIWGLILDPLLFLIYTTDLPTKTANDNKVVLFADNTSILVTNSHQKGLQTALNKTRSDIISWFQANFYNSTLKKKVLFRIWN